jgi:hypothetical protein
VIWDREPAQGAEIAPAIPELSAWRDEIRRKALGHLARKPDKPPRVLRILAVVVLVALHAGLLLGLRDAMRQQPAGDELPIRVRWIDLAQPEPALPQPLPLPPPSVRPRTTLPSVVANPPEAPVVPEPATQPPEESVLHLYTRDGSLDIPSDLAQQLERARPQPSFTPQSTQMSAVMVHQRPLKVRPNHFAAVWSASSGSALDDFVTTHLSAKKEFTMPWGSKVVCRSSIFLSLVGGCEWGFPPPHWDPPQPWKPASALDEE